MAAQRTHADHDQDRDEEQQRQPGVGALLRASRLRCGEELRDIAELLCIRYLYLEAIEAGRYHDLPGTTYAIGFIRAYAEHLGLDSEEVVRRFKAEQSTLRRQDELAFPTPVPESGIPKGAIVFVGLIVAGLAYGAWYLSSSEDGGLADLIGPLPERLESLVGGADGSRSAAPGGEAPTAPASETADATAAQPETTTASPQAAPSDVSQAPAADDSAPPASTPAEAPAADQPSDASVASPAADEPDAAATAPAEAGTPAAEQATTASSETAANETAVPAPQAPAETAAPAAPSAESDQQPAEPGSSEPAAGTVAPAAETASPAPETDAAATPTPAETTAPEPASEPAASAEPEPAPAEAATAETAPAAPAPSEPASDPAPQTDTAPPAAPAEETPEPASAPADEVAVAGGSGILIRAVDNSWVQIRDADSNETVITRLLRAGEEITVEGRPGLMLATGNAGGLEIVVDGNVVPSIGGPGTVRRNVALDADRLKAGTALP